MRTLLWIIFAAVAAHNSPAYIPGPVEIRECPQCQASFALGTTTSGNTFGATYWTDGRVFAPMLPDRGLVLKCPNCKAVYFWLDARLLRFRRPGEEHGLQDAMVPDEHDYHELLKSTPLVPEDELYARTRAWQCSNDPYRGGSSEPRQLSAAQQHNLMRIIELADDSKLSERLLKAEALRALGEFQRCLSLLADREKIGEGEPTARVIRNLAVLGVRGVQIVGKKPNKAPEPIPTSVTSPAAHESRQP